VWSLDGAQNVLSLRVHIHSLQDHQKIEQLKAVIREIASRHAVAEQHVTIETCLVGGACAE
jgi:Co/Zn/Cd efflux system component